MISAAIQNRFERNLKKHGLAKTVLKVIQAPFKKPDYIFTRQIELSKMLFRQFDGIIRYGPFKGMKLNGDSRWGDRDKGSMLLGIYEQEILDSFATLPDTHKTFIDLGAADGYYGIGLLVGGLSERSYCFEISETGRKTIKQTARLNGVESRIEIQGEAETGFLNVLKKDGVDLSKTVMICDIEGAEFDVLTEEVFRDLQGSVIFIELHEWLRESGAEQVDRLKKAASSYFEISEMTTTARDLSRFPELKELPDIDRWLICSENRRRLMTWLKLEPKSNPPS